jgi:hypothetical protein
MAGLFYPLVRTRFPAAAAIGAWAAAIALAPTPVFKLILAAPAVLIPFAWWIVESPSRWVICFLAAAIVLPPLPIALGDSGPHICLLFAAVGLFCGVLSLRRWRVLASPLNASLASLFVVCLASVAPAAIYSGAPVAAGSLMRVVLFGIALYVFWYTAYGPGSATVFFPAIRWIYWLAVISALFACVDFYFQFPAPAGYGAQFVWLDTGVYRRAQGVFYDAGALGNFCAFFLIMIAVALSKASSRFIVSRKALALGGVIFFAALVLSYSRSSLINVLVGLAVLAWLNRRRVRLARVAAIVVVGGGCAALLTWKLFPQFLEEYWTRVSSSAQFFFSATEGVLSGRVASWYILRDWLASHPWQALLGIGYKTLPYTDYLGAPVVGDNMYLTLLVETGILGLAALLWLHIAILRAAGRGVNAADPHKAWLSTWILCFWSGQVVQMLSVDLLTFWRLLPLYLWVLALAIRP